MIYKYIVMTLFVAVIVSLFWYQAEKITLFLLYLVGMNQVDLLHVGYLIFFLVFFSVSSRTVRFVDSTFLFIIVFQSFKICQFDSFLF